MIAPELLALIKAGLEDVVDNENSSVPMFCSVDIIEGEDTLGVEANDGTRFFVTLEPV